MRSPLGVFIFLSVMMLLDFYFFQAIKTVSQSASPRLKTIIFTVYWSISVLAIIGFLIFVYSDQQFLGKRIRTYLFATIIGLFLAKMSALVFFLADDLRRGVQWLAGKLFNQKKELLSATDEGISRSAFLSWLCIATGSTLFGGLLYGFSN